MAFFKLTPLLLILLISGCKSQEDLGDCNDISMKCFRGYPRACNTLKTKCSNETVTYTSKRCQAAFNQLILGHNLQSVEKTYGPRISGCFNDKEIKKYSN